jgi:O-antigen ligase
MNFSLKKIILKRETILMVLITLIFISYIISRAINSITIFLFIGFFFLDSREQIRLKIKKIKKNKLVLTYILFFSIQLIGVLYSKNITFAVRRIEVMLPILFLPAILSTEILNKKQFYKVLEIVKYCVVSIFLYYLFYHLIIDKRGLNTFVLFILNDKLSVSQFYLAFILFIPLLISLKHLIDKKFILINSITFFISLFFLFLLGNITTLLVLLILSSFFLLKIFKVNKKISVLLFFIFLIIGSFAYQLPILKNKINVLVKTTDFNIKTIKTKNKFTVTRNTFEHRLLFNHLALKEIKKAFPFGVGTGDFQQKLDEQYKRVGFKFGMKGNVNNHNQYLEEFLKTGILGGFTFLILIFMLIKKGFSEIYFAFPIILFFALGCLVESYLFRQHGVVIFAFIIPFFIFKKT